MILRYGFVIACCAWFLAGCSSARIAEEQSKIPLGSAQSDRDGIVFVTLGTQQPKPFGFVSMSIRPLGQGRRTLKEDMDTRPHLHRLYFRYEGTGIRLPSDFSDATESGTLHVAALPPGDYEIFSFGFVWGNYNAFSNPYFSIPFRVRAGEALYLGRFIGRLTGIKEKTGLIFNTETPERAFFDVRSTFSADVSLLESRLAAGRGFRIVDGNLPACAHPTRVRCAR